MPSKTTREVVTGLARSRRRVENSWSAFDYVTTLRDVTSTRTGVNNPSFKKQIKSGTQAGTSLTATREKWSVKDNSCVIVFDIDPSSPIGDRAYQWDGVYSRITNTLLTPYPSYVDFAAVDAEALGRLYKALKEVRQQFSSGTFLGELRETVGLIRHPATGISKFLHQHMDRVALSARRLKPGPKTKRHLLDVVTDSWLTCFLGIKPLLADCNDIALSLARSIGEIRHQRVRGFSEGTAVVPGSDVGPIIMWSGYVNAYDRVDLIQNYKVIYRCGLSDSAFPTQSSFDHYRSLIGIDLSDFVPTLWELIPYSFVVDYFSNVGDVISSAFVGESVSKWLLKTTILKNEVIASSRLEPHPSVVSFLKSSSGTLGYGSGSGFRRTVTRTPLASLPSLPLSFGVPALGKWQQWGNVGALAVARARGISSGFHHL
jgi:hypothetical protein